MTIHFLGSPAQNASAAYRGEQDSRPTGRVPSQPLPTFPRPKTRGHHPIVRVTIWGAPEAPAADKQGAGEFPSASDEPPAAEADLDDLPF